MISVVVPVFNEAENLPGLLHAVKSALEGLPHEVIVVDDGSADQSPQILHRLAQTHSQMTVLLLAKNYGQSTALQAGFDHARGRFIVTMDGDLQNDPADIPGMIAFLESNPQVDMVSGWRKSRQDAALSRRLPSQLANWLISRITGVQLHDYGCALKAYRANIIANLRLYGEQHRFIPALAAQVGAKIIERPVNHRARVAGRSNYGLDRTTRVLLDLLWVWFSLRFLHRPMHAFGTLGIAMLAAGGLILLGLVAQKFLAGVDIGGRPLLLLGALLTLMGGQFLVAGILGELLIRVYHEPKGRPQYILKPPPERMPASGP